MLVWWWQIHRADMLELNQQLFKLLQTCLCYWKEKRHLYSECWSNAVYKKLIWGFYMLNQWDRDEIITQMWIWTRALSKFTFCSHLSGSRGWNKRKNSETNSWLMSFSCHFFIYIPWMIAKTDNLRTHWDVSTNYRGCSKMFQDQIT